MFLLGDEGRFFIVILSTRNPGRHQRVGQCFRADRRASSLPAQHCDTIMDWAGRCQESAGCLMCVVVVPALAVVFTKVSQLLHPIQLTVHLSLFPGTKPLSPCCRGASLLRLYRSNQLQRNKHFHQISGISLIRFAPKSQVKRHTVRTSSAMYSLLPKRTLTPKKAQMSSSPQLSLSSRVHQKLCSHTWGVDSWSWTKSGLGSKIASSPKIPKDPIIREGITNLVPGTYDFALWNSKYRTLTKTQTCGLAHLLDGHNVTRLPISALPNSSIGSLAAQPLRTISKHLQTQPILAARLVSWRPLQTSSYQVSRNYLWASEMLQGSAQRGQNHWHLRRKWTEVKNDEHTNQLVI